MHDPPVVVALNVAVVTAILGGRACDRCALTRSSRAALGMGIGAQSWKLHQLLLCRHEQNVDFAAWSGRDRWTCSHWLSVVPLSTTNET